MAINLERIKKHLEEIGEISSTAGKGYSRLAYSSEEQKALDWLSNKLKENNIFTYRDEVGNVFGRIGDPDGKALLIGSHLDTVPNGGLYDGALGVMVGLECLLSLKESKNENSIPLELAAFVGEEANILGGTFGSRSFVGKVDIVDLEEKLKEVNFTAEDIVKLRKKEKNYFSFLELHIEQGTVLEKTNNKIGVVTAIAGIIRLEAEITGTASHSGTTPMELRNDALLQASQVVIEVNHIAKSLGGNNVATVGEIKISPNLANVVPGSSTLTIEIRGSEWSEMKESEYKIREFIKSNINATVKNIVEKKPNALSGSVQNRIKEACEAKNVPHVFMMSGANHDANSLVGIMDVGMLFIPSKDGVSHHPEEFSSWQDIEIGANIMADTLKLLDSYYS